MNKVHAIGVAAAGCDKVCEEVLLGQICRAQLDMDKAHGKPIERQPDKRWNDRIDEILLRHQVEPDRRNACDREQNDGDRQRAFCRKACFFLKVEQDAEGEAGQLVGKKIVQKGIVVWIKFVVCDARDISQQHTVQDKKNNRYYHDKRPL